MKKYSELILGIFMLALAVIYGVSTYFVKIRVVTSISARYVPYMLAGLCFVLGVFQTGRGYRYLMGKTVVEVDNDPNDTKTVLIVFAAFAAYILTMRAVGFIITTSLLTFALMMLLCPRKKRKPLQFAVIAVVATVAVYFAFRQGLHLMLPAGILG